MLLLSSFSVSVYAKLASKVGNTSTTADPSTSSSWSSSWLTPPSRQEFEKDMEKHWKQLEQDVAFHKTRLHQHLQDIHYSAQATLEETKHNIKNTETKIKRKVERNVLKQRQGWQRFRLSVRDHVGLFLGTTMAFAGSTCLTPSMCSGLQAGQSTWFSLATTNITRMISIRGSRMPSQHSWL